MRRSLSVICSIVAFVTVALPAVPTLARAAGPDQDCAAIQRALIASGQPVPGACGQFNDSALFAGGCANPFEAKEFLKSRTGNKDSINDLTPEFACKLMNFIKAAPGSITIGVGVYQINPENTVANKGVEFCRVMQCVEGSNSHPRGLAADIIYNGKTMKPVASTIEQCRRDSLCTWAHQNADAFGLQFRLMPGHPCYPGRPEAWHIELKGTACGGDSTPSGSGQQLAGSGNIPPSSGLGGMVRDALYGPSAPLAAPQPLGVSSAVTDTFSPASLVTSSLQDGTGAVVTPAADTGTGDAARRLAELAATQPPVAPASNAGNVIPVSLGTDARTIASYQGTLAPTGGDTGSYASYVPTQASFTLGTGSTGTQTWLDTLAWYATPFGGYPGGRTGEPLYEI